MAEIRLAGCGTRPLGGYLKALGVLRVVARQADRCARGRWWQGTFELASRLELDALYAFFLEQYAPSPVVSPWNGGSGFFPKVRTEPIEAILASNSQRLAAYRAAIAVAQEVLLRRDLREKPSTAVKAALLRELRRELPDAALDWLDAAVVLTGDAIAYPPILGSGGNDGRYDFSNNYMGAVVACVADLSSAARTRAADLLAAAVVGTAAPLDGGLSLAYLRRDSSPVNSPFGEASSLGNPWDVILALEGTLLMCAGAARRLGWELEPRLVAPFTADVVATGYGSAATGEKAYAELWLPQWTGWSSLSEVEQLTREARAQVGRRRARSGLDFVRAAGELGVARGIDAFERYSILERAGQARLAVPTGRIEVRERSHVRALHSLDPWLARLQRISSNDRCPRAVAQAARNMDRALFDFAATPSPARAQAVVIALGEAETALARSARRSAEAGARPLKGVPAERWLDVLEDGSSELELAAALGSLTAGRKGPADMRDYLHGTRLATSGERMFDPGFKPPVPRAGDVVARLAAIHVRRHVDAERDDTEGLNFPCRWPASANTLRAFVLGQLDDHRILQLALGLSLLNFRHTRVQRREPLEQAPCPAFDALAIAWHPEPANLGVVGASVEPSSDRRLQRPPLGARPGWAARLAAAGTDARQTERVLREALLRLRLGLEHRRPLASSAELAAAAPPGPRLLAALLIPPAAGDWQQMMLGLTEPCDETPPRRRDDHRPT